MIYISANQKTYAIIQNDILVMAEGPAEGKIYNKN